MPYRADHEVFPPMADETALWRYIDLPRFIAMLSKQELHLARVDLLDDPFEGTIPAASRADWRDVLGNRATDEMTDRLETFTRSHTYVSSWIAKPHESDAMWRIYAKESGIAVRTTYGRLRDALSSPREFYITAIRYEDYGTVVMPTDNAFWPHVHKRLAFDYESEARVVCAFVPEGGGAGPESVNLALDVESGIAEAIVSPYAPSWFRGVVEDVVGRYGSALPVRASGLASLP